MEEILSNELMNIAEAVKPFRIECMNGYATKTTF